MVSNKHNSDKTQDMELKRIKSSNKHTQKVQENKEIQKKKK